MASLGTLGVTTAVTASLIGSVATGLGKVNSLSLTCKFTYVASAATTVKVYIQTSLDGGSNWYDIKQFAFTTSSAVRNANVDGNAQITSATPTTGSMSDDAIAHGLIGDRIRAVVTSTGTYGSGTEVTVDYQTR